MEWQISHPIFLSVGNSKYQNINDFIRINKIHSNLIGDLSVLTPAPLASIFSREAPKLKDYVQLPLHLWVPDFFMPELVPFMPCFHAGCNNITTRQRWKKGGPRVIHDIDHAIYLHRQDYRCSIHGEFSGTNNDSISRLPSLARQRFIYVLSREDGITINLANRIANARLIASSFNALRKELVTLRYERMYFHIHAYYEHCQHVREFNQSTKNILSSLFGRGSEIAFDDFPPTFNNPIGYYDHEPLSISSMSDYYEKYCETRISYWQTHAQHQTSDRVSIDATFKIAKKISKSTMTRLWSLIDVNTGVILHQQLITHEFHRDVLPMFNEYANRCRELGQSLPSRICSDRGLMDAKVINDPKAFPNADINVDPWHFIANFAKTLNKSSNVWREVKTLFSQCLYSQKADHDGKLFLVHGEPQSIVEKVDALLKLYSFGGQTSAAITADTNRWWQLQRPEILNHRILSNPESLLSTDPQGRMSSSAQENYHKHLNRLSRFIKMKQSMIHCFLMHMMFVWNIDRLIAAGLEHNWFSYNHQLVAAAFDSTVKVLGRNYAESLWPNGNGFYLYRPLVLPEHFGLKHNNVTENEQIRAVTSHFPFNTDELHQIIDYHAANQFFVPGSTIRKMMNVNSNSSQLIACSQSTSSSSSLPSSLSSSLVQPNSSSSFIIETTIDSKNIVNTLSHHEIGWLRALISNDYIMRELIDGENFTLAATRWNSFVNDVKENKSKMKSSVSRYPIPVEYLTADALKRTLIVLQRIDEKKSEKELIDMVQLSSNSPSLTASPSKKVYEVVPVKSQPMNKHEWETLESLMKIHTIDDKVKWTSLSVKWRTMWLAEQKAAISNGILPRSLESLKSSANSERRRVGKRKLNETSNISEIEESDETNNSNNKKKKITNIKTNAEDSNNITISNDTNNNNNNNNNIDDIKTVRYNQLDDVAVKKTSPWTLESSKEFEKLYYEYGDQWTYRVFDARWDKNKFGVVDRQQWKNKNGSIRKKLNNEKLKRML